MESPRRVDVEIPLWPLAALCGLLPLVAAHTGWLVSTVQGLIPACNPYIDGCTSISRASRHGLANQLFRMLMLPAATLQGLCWVVVACWSRRYASRTGSTAWLGVVAAIALIAYATFLGTDGSTYEILRRYGIYFYFGCSYLALLASLRVLARHRQQRGTYRPLMVIAGVCLAVGLASLAVSYFVNDEATRDRFENMLEWHVALWLTATFGVLASVWKREAVTVRLS